MNLSQADRASDTSFKAEQMRVEGSSDLEGGQVHGEKNLHTEVDAVEIKRILWKIDIRLSPIFAIIYLLAYLDRGNIGNAKTLQSGTGDDLLQVTHMTTYQYLVALMAFLVAYSVFEIPCNLMLKKLSPSIWLPILVTGFGTLTVGLGFAKNFAQVTAIRFVLGMFESGIFAGMIYHVSFWYRPEQRSLRIAGFLCSATLAGAFGGALAYGIGHLNNARGLEAWRWLFIIEGLPSIAFGLLLFAIMPQYPETARFLSESEKATWIAYLGNTASKGGEKLDWEEVKTTLKNPWLFLHYISYTCIAIPVSSLSLFTPSIVAGLGYTGLTSQLFTVIPWSAAYLCSGAAAWYADHYNRRGWTACFFFAVASIAFIISAALPAHGTPTPSLSTKNFADSPPLSAYHARFAMLVFCTIGAFAPLSPLCGWVSSNVRNSSAAAVANGANITFSGPGQVIGVWIYKANQSPIYQTGHGVNAASSALGAILIAILTIRYKSLNKRGMTVGGHAYAT